jgi:hypothetical protein
MIIITAIRVATRWYEQHLSEVANANGTTPIRVVLITNDVDNRNKALQDSLLTCSGRIDIMNNMI